MKELRIKSFVHNSGKDLIIIDDKKSFDELYKGQNIWCLVDNEGTAWVMMEGANGMCERYEQQKNLEKPTRSRRVLSRTKK